jgi:hypothetical protein
MKQKNAFSASDRGQSLYLLHALHGLNDVGAQGKGRQAEIAFAGMTIANTRGTYYTAAKALSNSASRYRCPSPRPRVGRFTPTPHP